MTDNEALIAELDRLTRLAGAATEGPWVRASASPLGAGAYVWSPTVACVVADGGVADVAFIAETRVVLPALLDAARVILARTPAPTDDAWAEGYNTGLRIAKQCVADALIRATAQAAPR